MTILPPHMMDLMKMMPMKNTAMPEHKTNSAPMDEKMKADEMNKMVMEQTQKLFPMILAGALVSHIAFGAALGMVVTPIVKRASEISSRR